MINTSELLFRLALSAVFGAVVGYERERLRRPAGLRTHMLVCIGSTLITLVSIYGLPGADPSRIASGIVTGIGFLGAGTIFKNKNQIVGLTTAATLWAVAGLGMAIGAGFYIAACFSLPMIFGVLCLSRFEYKKQKLPKKGRSKTL